MYRIALCILCLASIAFAQNHIEVIYPKDGQQIAGVDSTFIFGNTHPKASLTINGHTVEVYKDGGFLAFLPVRHGDFQFDLISDYKGDAALTSVHIIVGYQPDSLNDFVDYSSIFPSGRTVLPKNEPLEFSINALAGGRAYCSLAGDSNWTAMYSQEKQTAPNYVFGDISLLNSQDAYRDYLGYLKTEGLADSSRVYFLFEQDICDTAGQTVYSEFALDSTEYYIIKKPALPPRSIRLTGRPHIIRVAPDMGYKLINQPDGIRFIYAGETPDYYRVKLADGSTGYVRKVDSSLEPEGTPQPQGEASFITVDNYDNYIEVSAELGDKLPYEIHTDGDLMTVDIYYLNSDTDWIRFNDDAQKYVKSIWWSQPQDGVYRLNIRWYDDHFWGYTPAYEGTTFTLKLKKHLDTANPLSSPVKGLKIVLDPGHSHDPGAIGPSGLEEADPNLWIAYELRKILMNKGAEVLMTRMGHEDLGLYDRVDMANKWDADLLISIHNNALPDGINPFTHNGTSAYYYFNQARPLAEAIHKHLLEKTGLPDHGLYHGNLALCRVTDCPAVLVECAFMMIPEQEAMLKTDKFQRKCAKAIYEGICDYLRP